MKAATVIPFYNESEETVLGVVSQAIEVVASDERLFFFFLDNGSDAPVLPVFLSAVPAHYHRNIRLVTKIVNEGYGAGLKYALIQACESEEEFDVVGWSHGDGQCALHDALISLEMLSARRFKFVKGQRSGRRPVDRFISSAMAFLCSFIFSKRLSEINAQPNHGYRQDIQPLLESAPNDFNFDLWVYSSLLKRHGDEAIGRFSVEFLARLEGKSRWNSGLISVIRFSIKVLIFAWRVRSDTRGKKF